MIEVSEAQRQALRDADEVVVIDPLTRQTYHLVRDDVYRQLKGQYDDSPWTAGETGILAGRAFGQLDDTDYSEYLR